MIFTGTRVQLTQSVRSTDYRKSVLIEALSEGVVILPNLPNDEHVVLVGTGRNSHRVIVSKDQIKSVR